MTSSAAAPVAVPPGVRKALLGEVVERLETLARAIGSGAGGGQHRQHARLAEILAVLERSSGAESVLADAPSAAVYRSIGRMVTLAVAENDPQRCRQGIPLVQTLMQPHEPIASIRVNC